MLQEIYSVKKNTQKETVAEIKKILLESNLPTLEGKFMNKKYITLYLIEKNHSKFHIFGVFEPDITKLSGKNGILTEIYFDFAKSEYWVKRNLKEVLFSARNIDSTLEPFSKERFFKFVQPENDTNFLGQMYQLSKMLNSTYSNASYSLSKFFSDISSKFRGIEILVKAGYFDLINSYSTLNDLKLHETKPHKIIGLPKKALSLYINNKDIIEDIHSSRRFMELFIMDYSSVGFNALNEKEKAEYISHIEFVFSLGEKYGFLDFTQVSHIVTTSLVADEDKIFFYRYFDTLTKEFNYDVRTLLEYLLFKVNVEQGITSAYEASTLLKDYVSMSEDLGSSYIRYPSSLKLVHDITRRNYEVHIDERQEEVWKKLAEDHSSYNNWTKHGSDFLILYPSVPQELIKEGNALSHCVSSYVRSVINKTTSIVFLREKSAPNDSLYTIEIKDNAIVQARGRFNKEIEGAAKDFLEDFAKEFKLKLAF